MSNEIVVDIETQNILPRAGREDGGFKSLYCLYL